MPVEIVCKFCGKKFMVPPSVAARNKQFCSFNCLREYRKKHIKRASSICRTCGRVFQHPSAQKRLFCSTKCWGIYKTQIGTTYVTCQMCGKQFKVTLHNAKGRVACSRQCFLKLREKKFETKNCIVCGKAFTFYSKRRKAAKYCSKACKIIAQIRNKENNLASKYLNKSARSFRRVWGPKLRKIWGNECMVCGWDEAPTDICHIVPVKDGGANTIDNIVLLCPNHHRMFDLGLIQREHLVASVQKLQLATGLCSQ